MHDRGLDLTISKAGSFVHSFVECMADNNIRFKGAYTSQRGLLSVSPSGASIYRDYSRYSFRDSLYPYLKLTAAQRTSSNQ
jgi:hypothetical protein